MQNSLQLYRQSQPTVIIPVDEQTLYFDECMGRFDIVADFYSDQVLDIRVDDYIVYNGVRFTINVPYQIARSSVIHYNITFEHPSYWLKDIAFKHLSAIEFDYFGTPRMYVQRIVENMNVDDSGWMVGACEDIPEQAISFYASGHGYNCKGALTYVAEQFGLEYWFSGDGKTINLTKQAGNDTNIHFAYGRTKGLYSVERGVLETPLYNRIYGFGGTTNLKTSYRSGAKRLTFEGGYIERPLLEGERRRETSVVFDDIFPERTGTITAVSSDYLSLSDSSIDFDLEGKRIDGEQAKVVFKSGELSGREFEIERYNHSTKTIKIKSNTATNDEVVPSSAWRAVVGDKYTLVGIDQPQTYIDAAEARLRKEVEDSFKQLTRPPYTVEIDEKYMRENAFSLKSGDRVRLVDEKLGIDDMIRVTSVSFPLVNPCQATVVISDKITYTVEAQAIIEREKIKNEVKVVNRKKSEEQRIQAMRMRQLQGLVFDPDGYFNGENIKPNSIETLMLSVGAKSQNFYLNGVRFEANNGDDPSVFVVGAGQLVHREIQIEGLGYIWEIGGSIFDALDPAKHYYLSVRASRTALTGTWYLSETPMSAESQAGFIHFNVGVLYAVHEGRRDTAFTYGMTYINGDNITTGKISAERIDVDELFAQYIEAENFNLKQGWIGNFLINGGAIDTLEPISQTYEGMVRLATDGIQWKSRMMPTRPSLERPQAFFRVRDGYSIVSIRADHGTLNPMRTGLEIEMPGLTAMDIKGDFLQEGDFVTAGALRVGADANFRGGVSVTNANGTYTGETFSQDIGGGYYINFVKGVFVGTSTVPLTPE